MPEAGTATRVATACESDVISTVGTLNSQLNLDFEPNKSNIQLTHKYSICHDLAVFKMLFCKALIVIINIRTRKGNVIAKGVAKHKQKARK